METKLGWISGVTYSDHIPNAGMHYRYDVAPIVKKMRERPLRQYGHVIRADENSLAKIGLMNKSQWETTKSLPIQRWLDLLNIDLRASRLHPDQIINR